MTSTPQPLSSRRPARRLLPLAAACVLLLTACAVRDLPPYDPDAAPIGTTTPVVPAQPPAAAVPPAPPVAPAVPGAATQPVPEPAAGPAAPPPAAAWPEPAPQPLPPAGEPAPAPPVVQEFICDAEPAQSAIGQPYSAALLNQVRERSNARGVRVLRPGDVTTMEFNAQRANLVLDGDNKVEAVRCG